MVMPMRRVIISPRLEIPPSLSHRRSVVGWRGSNRLRLKPGKRSMKRESPRWLITLMGDMALAPKMTTSLSPMDGLRTPFDSLRVSSRAGSFHNGTSPSQNPFLSSLSTLFLMSSDIRMFSTSDKGIQDEEEEISPARPQSAKLLEQNRLIR